MLSIDVFAWCYTAALMALQVILQDMSDFLIVLAVILIGVTSFLLINEPFSDAFGLDDDVVGPFMPLLTVVLTMTSQLSFEEANYTSIQSIVMLIFFIFFVVIVL